MTLIPGNLLSYNAQSIETDTSAWTITSGPGTLSQSSAEALDGTYSLLCTSTGAGSISIVLNAGVPITAGETYQAYFSCWNNTYNSVLIEIDYYDSSGHNLYVLENPAAPYVLAPGVFSQLSMVLTAPAGAVGASLVMHPQAASSGNLFYFDQMYLGSPALAVTVTPNGSLAYNEISVSGLTGWTTFSIQRTNPDGSQSIIRSANGISTGGVDAWTGFDVEAPLGAACTYAVIVEQPKPDGTTTTYQIVSPAVTIPVSSSVGWLKNLSQSALNTQVTIQTLSDVKRPSRQQVYPVVGRSNPVVVSDVLTGRTGTLSLMTIGTTDYQSILGLLQPGTTLFFQATPDDYFADMYFIAGDVTEQRPAQTSSDLTRIWQIDFTEVDSPSGALTSIPGNSYLLVTNFGTYQNLLDDRATYLSVLDEAYGTGPGGI